MSEPAEQQQRKPFEIVLSTENERELARVMFEERPGLAATFTKAFNIFITSPDPDHKICFTGADDDAAKAKKAFEMLVGALSTGAHISKELVKKIDRQLNPEKSLAAGFNAANQNNPAKDAAFEARSEKQKLQAELIEANDIVFSIGPAGTGKTHVAMVKAVHALKEKKVQKILLTRPATAAGEDLGYLPGDGNAKMAPYMRPLYDALNEIFGLGKYEQMLKSGVIEIVPLGFMRGRTFKNAFIVVDEAQNCTMEHLKMAITRLGPGSKMVITGDPEQVDLKPKSLSGLITIMEQLKGVEGVASQSYSPEDVVRHPTVKRIIDRLEGGQTAKAPKMEP